MATEYPRGAIKTVEELKRHVEVPIYHVSRIHNGRFYKIESHAIFTGVVGVIHYPDWDFHYWENRVKSIIGNGTYVRQESVQDDNLGGLNGYNDWFLFANKEDAEAYLRG